MKTVYLLKLFIVSIVLLGVSVTAFSQTSVFTYTGAIQTWMVPAGVTQLQVTARGAQGGGITGIGGTGAIIQGNISVTPGQVLKILVGQQGQATNADLNPFGNGGGGGSFVTTITNDPLIIAGGGGGEGVTDSAGQPGQLGNNGGTLGVLGEQGGTAGSGGDGANGEDGVCPASGGGGLTGNGGGVFGGNAFTNGGAGGSGISCRQLGYGGFGGGGAGGSGGGGGGGYSGGAAGSNSSSDYSGGGGGGSYNAGTSPSDNVGNTGNGSVVITIPNYPPSFVNESPQNTKVCKNSSLNISSLLAVNDINSGDTERWSIADSSSHGSLTGFNATAISNDGTVAPAGLVYTPATGYIGADTFTVQVSDGNGGTATSTIYVTVNAIPAPITGADSVCFGAMTTLTDDSTGGTWSSSNAAVAAVGSTGIVQGVSHGTAIITYTSAQGCTTTFTERVNRLPHVFPMDIAAVCNGSLTTIVRFAGNVPGAAYNWTSSSNGTGLGTNGTDSIGSFMALNGADTSVTDTIIVIPTAHGCTGPARHFTLTIKPTPTVDTIVSQAVCNGASTADVIFTGSAVDSTNYTWTNNDTLIGLAASGTDSIPSFIARDTVFTLSGMLIPITGVITVTPIASGCAGTVRSFAITVNPTPSVNASDNQTPCNGLPVAGITFTGPVSGSTFNWTNTDTSIGLAANGVDSIPSFTATDDSTFAIGGSITVTASTIACVGTSNSFTINVNPTPKLSSPLTGAVCDSVLFSYTPSSATEGTSYTWSRDTVSGISNPATAGNEGSINDTLVNTTTHPVAVTYVYALAAACTDTQNVVVTVNPRPVLSSALTDSVCSGTLFTYGPASATTGTTFTWSRDSVGGVSNTAGSGIDTIKETLINTTNTFVTVIYVDTLSANHCSNTESIHVTVKPKPTLSTILTAPSICDSTLFTYVPHSLVAGTAFTWSRALITGIGNLAAHGGDTISETLVNTSVNPVNVTYVDTLKANGCVNTQDIHVTVNPRPLLSSTLTPAAICDSALFDYTPLSATTGTTFTWYRPFVSGIALDSARGTGDPDEHLVNPTNSNVDVTYIYTDSANGCSYSQSVVVTVHPTPTLSSPLTASVCSGAPFYDTLTGFVFGTTFIWARPHTAGISPATGAGVESIHETLTDSALVPIATQYNITLTANGCTHEQSITVTVDPAPAQQAITTFPPSSACSNTLYQNFGTNVPPPAGQEYSWSATNATIWATGTGGQYILVNFPTQGDAVITLKSNVTGIACITNSAYSVTVGSSVSDMPSVIYYNGQFMCLENSDTYQWGFDDAHTLDSTLVPGEVNQTYFISGADLTNRNYWVITTHDGCMQKSYYNVPAGITNVNTGGAAGLKLYPNPASTVLNVDISTDAMAGNMEVRVLNMLGQQLSSVQAADHKAQINVAAYAAGCYLVDCYRDGVKIATARFIKN